MDSPFDEYALHITKLSGPLKTLSASIKLESSVALRTEVGACSRGHEEALSCISLGERDPTGARGRNNSRMPELYSNFPATTWLDYTFSYSTGGLNSISRRVLMQSE